MALSEKPTLKEVVDEAERLNNLIASYNGTTVTPSTSNKTLPKGYYKSNITVKGDSNLISSNIVSGKSIFGVSGIATPSSLGGKNYVTGEATVVRSGSYYYLHVTGLSFRPEVVVLANKSAIYTAYVLSTLYNKTSYSGPSATIPFTVYDKTNVSFDSAEAFVSNDAFKMRVSNSPSTSYYWMVFG